VSRTEHYGPIEVRYQTLDDGTEELDEIVATNATIHIEMMSESSCWASISTDNYKHDIHLWWSAGKNHRAVLNFRAEDESPPTREHCSEPS
jgi:hypothetical protein